MKQRIYIITVLTVIAALLLSGCTDIVSGSKIKEITTDPGKYDGTVVTVSGKVIEVGPIDGIGYKINDGSASIMIRSNKKNPKVGDEVSVKGTVRASQSGIVIDATTSE